MILFKSIKWRNFLSTGNAFTEITLDQSKSTLIVGENGAGKSTILDALSFALYGKPFRKINKPQLMNSINQKNLEVEVLFAIGKKTYRIVRGIKPSIFEIYENDILLNQEASSRDYQEVLEKNILKLNHKSFSQIVVLGSSTFVPFMQLSSSHRREVIEDLLDIQIFSIMNVLLKDKVSQNKGHLTDAQYNIDLTEEKIEMQKRYIESLKQTSEMQINDSKVKIAKAEIEKNNYNDSITTLMKDIQALQQSIEDSVQINNKKRKVEQLDYKFKEKITKLKHDIEFYNDHDNCPVCKQTIEEQFKNSTLEDKKQMLNETLDGYNLLDAEYQSINKRIEEIANVQQQVTLKQQQINNDNMQINALNKLIESINDHINSISTNVETKNKEQQILDKLEKNIVNLRKAKEKLVENRSVLDVASLILKDSGIKTRIIRQYIPVMNKLINKYLAAMDFFVQFELDDNFNETIKSRFRDEFSYASFSEGEKMRIDLSLLFTWRAIAKLRNSVSTNLLIMDEVFDSSLDAGGTEEFLKILNDLTTDTNVFIISHKGDQLFDKFETVIKFEKHKNFSRIAA